MENKAASKQCSDRTLKKNEAALYETDTFDSLLRDALHPGGLTLTRRIVEIVHPEKGSRVLDVACGKGGTSLILAQDYKCRVVGIDLSEKLISLARCSLEAKRLNNSLAFIVADAEELPFEDASFDTIISECSFSILPNKEKAASEMNRVLKSNGKLVMADIILRGRIPSGLESELTLKSQTSFHLFPCIAGAMSVENCVSLLGQAGFQNPHIEDHSVQLKKLAFQMVTRCGGMEGFSKNISSELSSDSCAKETQSKCPSAETYRRAFAQGRPGYALIMVNKP